MSRKLLSDPYLAIHGKIMGKKRHFSWNFDLFLTFFIDCDHIYVPNRDFFARNGQSGGWHRCFGAKYQFLFETVQKGPDGPKRVPNGSKRSFLLIFSARDDLVEIS